MKRTIILTPQQKKKFDKIIKQSEFDKKAMQILDNKKLSIDERAKQILYLKHKIFDK